MRMISIWLPAMGIIAGLFVSQQLGLAAVADANTAAVAALSVFMTAILSTSFTLADKRRKPAP